MTWLDREQTPVLFTVVTSVVSGLTVAIILNVFRDNVTESATLMWFALTAGGIAAVIWIGSRVFSRARKRSPRAFLVTSAFSQKYYMAALVQRLHSALDRNGIDLVLKVPDRDYDASDMSHHLSRILRSRRDYIGGIIVAADVDRLRDDLIMFCQKLRLPVVFADMEAFDKPSEYPDRTAFVGYDTGQLGELAGQWLVGRLRVKKRPRILIIASREHSARQQRCEQALRAGLRDPVITIIDSCEFSRSRAYTAVRSYIRQLRSRQYLDAIVCTNDEMALGAVEALSSPAPGTQATVVVGIDGVLEAKALIDTADCPLQATVVQDTHRLAVSVVEALEKIRRGGRVPKRTFLPAEVYDTTSV
jgi:ribose transport system substrate-binding protein